MKDKIPAKTKPTIHKRQIVAESRLFKVEALDLRFTNGVEVQFERLVGSAYGAVLIVPMLDDDTVLLIREYAAGTDDYVLGLPKGRVEAGEDILAAANREIMEEVGYGARRLEHLKSVSLAPGYQSHKTHLVLARDLYPQTADGDEPEPIDVVPWKLSDLDYLLTREDFHEARSITALFLTRALLQPT